MSDMDWENISDATPSLSWPPQPSHNITNDEIERLRAELAAERETTVSLLRIIALIREAGKFTREDLDALPGAVKAMREKRDEARELYCRQIAYGLFRTTGVFDPKEIAIKRGWAGLFKANEPAPREKEGGGA